MVKSVSSTGLACWVTWVLLNSLSGLDTSSVVPARTATKVCRLLVLLVKGMISQDMLVD